MAKRKDTVEYLGKEYPVHQNDDGKDLVEIEHEVKRILWDPQDAHRRLWEREFSNYFVECDIEFLDSYYEDDSSNLKIISNNIFKRNFSFCKSELEEISGNKFLSRAEFVGIKLSNFIQNDFHNEVEFASVSSRCSVVNFRGNIFRGMAAFVDVDIENFYCREFHNSIEFSGVNFQKKLYFQMINPGDSSASSSLSFINSSLNDSTITIVYKAPFSGIDLEGCTFNSELKIHLEEILPRPKEKEYIDALARKARLPKLEITDCTATNEAYIRIGYLDIGRFLLGNLKNPRDTELNIGNCHFENFQIDNCRELGKFKLYNINILQGEREGNFEFNISNTSIEDTKFQNLVLTSFEKVRLFDNIFDSIKYTNVDWPDTIRVGKFHEYQAVEQPQRDEAVEQPLYNREIKRSKKRDTYRVLKNVAQQNNDEQAALKFYVKEMQYHKKLIRCWSLEWITLGFNSITNDFGQNWWRPIWLLFFVGMFFYIALRCYSGEDIPALTHWQGDMLTATKGQELLDLIKGVLRFIDPIDRIKSPEQYPNDSWAHAIELLFRIIEGALIYQAIIAFRKFSRKV